MGDLSNLYKFVELILDTMNVEIAREWNKLEYNKLVK